METKKKAVYKVEIAKVLIDEGFELISIEQNPINEKWHMYLFTWSDELERRVKELSYTGDLRKWTN